MDQVVNSGSNFIRQVISAGGGGGGQADGNGVNGGSGSGGGASAFPSGTTMQVEQVIPLQLVQLKAKMVEHGFGTQSGGFHGAGAGGGGS